MSDNDSPTPRSRGARRPAAPATTCCLRCASHFGEDDAPACNASFAGSQRRKCARCANQRHACEELVDPHVVKLLNKAHAAQAAVAAAAARNASADEATKLADRLAARTAALRTGLRQFHQNKNKMTGERFTPRKGGARGSLASSGGLSEAAALDLQDIRKGIFALVEVGRELVRVAGGDTSGVNRVMGGEEEEESESASSSSDDDGDEDGMDEGGA